MLTVHPTSNSNNKNAPQVLVQAYEAQAHNKEGGNGGDPDEINYCVTSPFVSTYGDDSYICTNSEKDKALWEIILSLKKAQSDTTPTSSSSHSISHSSSSSSSSSSSYSSGGTRKANRLYADGRIDAGVVQRIDGSDAEKVAVKVVLRQMDDYFKFEIMGNSAYKDIRGQCKNYNELCAFWTSVGECESNRGFMLSNCAASCRLCLL
eukprot:CAMPEP_0178947490 /NCGR_PEP_ID=MMETSP0789-20121207/4885_1 /TAXON_ID=3005 /ORGANISM="Rhizosolenia setigera, Strain CCMP 1694" /LENGTH=206 /DNA_ID=CAMNT_0020627629 /DNA_START=55 /DNA_END=672 /DNA_ORIENTATION=+